MSTSVKRFTVVLPEEMHTKATAVADRMGISLNDLIRKLLWDFFESGEKTVAEVVQNFERRLDENTQIQNFLMKKLEELEKRMDEKK